MVVGVYVCLVWVLLMCPIGEIVVFPLVRKIMVCFVRLHCWCC